MNAAGYQLQKLTECCICFKVFTDPRMLPCIHTFCLDCLIQTAEAANKKPGQNMQCPLCRRVFFIPAQGMNGLQKNFFIEHLIEVTDNLQFNNISDVACDICKDLYEGDEKTKTATMRCLECSDNFCCLCAKAHKLHRLSRNHQVVNIGSDIEEDIKHFCPTRNCTVHDEKPLDYYCPQCKKIVCVSCVVENHAPHGCKAVSKVEEEFRQAIERNALKISNYADEMLAKAKSVEQKKENIVLQLKEIESAVKQRYLELKKLIDNQTEDLMKELFLIKEKHIKNCENEKKEIDQIHTILTSFVTYCTELRSKGSDGDVCSCLDELLTRTSELEKDHEEIIGRPCTTIELSFKTTYLGDVLDSSSCNVVGQIQEDTSHFDKCFVIVGLGNDRSKMNNVVKISLHRPNEISAIPEIPTTMRNGAAAAVFRDTLYVSGMGDNHDEIWKYNAGSCWRKCASLVQGRRRHSAAFIDKVMYICGGNVAYDGSVLDSVEAYRVARKCTTVGKLVHCVQGSSNCVPVKSSIYIFGGTDKHNVPLDLVQVYNTEQNTCTLLSKPMPCSYSLMRAALWETSVIIIGHDSCFIYDLEAETWHERKQFKTDVVHFGLALENDRLFVIGGGTVASDETGKVTWTFRDDVRCVPLKSVIDDKPVEWRNYAKLTMPTLVQAYGKCVFLPRTGNNQPVM